jgi:hypothetical protein
MSKPPRSPTCHELHARLAKLEASHKRLTNAVVILARINRRMLDEANKFMSKPL